MPHKHPAPHPTAHKHSILRQRASSVGGASKLQAVTQQAHSEGKSCSHLGLTVSFVNEPRVYDVHCLENRITLWNSTQNVSNALPSNSCHFLYSENCIRGIFNVHLHSHQCQTMSNVAEQSCSLGRIELFFFFFHLGRMSSRFNSKQLHSKEKMESNFTKTRKPTWKIISSPVYC